MNKRSKNNIKYVCLSAIIAALYVVLTLASDVFGLSSGPIQCRISEALCVLPYFTPAAIPGVTIGCFVSNLFTTANPIDIVFGTLATFLGVLGAYYLRKYKWLVPLPTILSNTLIIPVVLEFAYNFSEGIFFFFATIFIGEFISVGVLGMLLIFAICRTKLFDKFM